MSTCERRREKRQERRRQREEAHLADYFRRVDAVVAGEAPAAYEKGGWPFWTYHATLVKSLDYQSACAFGGDEREDYGDFAPDGYANTVQFPATCSARTGKPNMHDHNDVTGSTCGSTGRRRQRSLERMGEALAAHDNAVAMIENEAVPELDDTPATLAAGDDTLISTATPAANGRISPSYVRAVASPFPTRLVEALGIKKTRDRHRALGKVLRDIRTHATVTFYVRTRLYLTWTDPGFGAYLRQRDYGVHHRGHRSRKRGN